MNQKITSTFLILVILSVCQSRPHPQFNFGNLFGGGGNNNNNNGGFNHKNVNNAITGIGTLATAFVAFDNIQKGKGDVSISPTFGASIDDNGQLNPEGGIVINTGDNVKSGLHLGVQGNQQGLSPFVGTSLGASNGQLGGNVNSGLVFRPDGTTGTKVGGGVTVGEFGVGHISNPFRGR